MRLVCVLVSGFLTGTVLGFMFLRSNRKESFVEFVKAYAYTISNQSESSHSHFSISAWVEWKAQREEIHFSP